MQLALKMGLNSQQQLRQIWACTQQVWLVPTEGELIKALIKCGTNYHNQTKKEGKGHKLGKPFLHCWGPLVSFLVTTEWPKHNMISNFMRSTDLPSHMKHPVDSGIHETGRVRAASREEQCGVTFFRLAICLKSTGHLRQ